MLSLKFIRENTKQVKANLKRRKDAEKLKLVDDVLNLDKQFLDMKKKLDDLRHKRNVYSSAINKLKKTGKDAKKEIKGAREVSAKISKQEEKMKDLQAKLRTALMRVPNMLHKSVPYGKDDTENVEVRKWGKPKKFKFDLVSHVDIAEKLGVADFERSAKTAGSGFYYLIGELGLLNQALIRLAIDHLVKKGYTYVEPPLIMLRKPYEGVTDLADFESVMYKIDGEDMYMIATSEHPLGAMFMNETIDEDDLPLKLAGYSICFRKEIGSHGIDTKGLFRTHQFNKVEQFVFCKPEDSEKLHEEIVKNQEEILKLLDIPYRVVNICTGDIGIVAAKKYDVEAWMPRVNKYKEICSGSNCTEYQARRLNIKCGKEGGEKRVLHTLNATAMATSRIMVAILENYQNKDGTITVPKVLQRYMNGIKLIGKPAKKSKPKKEKRPVKKKKKSKKGELK